MTSQRGYSPREWEHFVSKRGEQKKPDRFILLGRTFDVEDWVDVYDRFLRELEQRLPEKFYGLPDTRCFHSGATLTRRFTRVREDVIDKVDHGHGDPLELPGGSLGPIYCKGSMAVERMFPNVCKLLGMFGIPETEMTIYLRGERQEL